jgi:hypothetical protein
LLALPFPFKSLIAIAPAWGRQVTPETQCEIKPFEAQSHLLAKRGIQCRNLFSHISKRFYLVCPVVGTYNKSRATQSQQSGNYHTPVAWSCDESKTPDGQDAHTCEAADV